MPELQRLKNRIDLFPKELILEHVATRRQNARHLRYTPAGSVACVSDARNTTQAAGFPRY